MKFDKNVFCVMFGFISVILLSTLLFAQTLQSDQESIEYYTDAKGDEMETKISTRRAMKIVGLELPEKMEPYILQLWIKLNTMMASVPNQVNPHMLYGIYKGEMVGDKIHYSYMVGIEVTDIIEVPVGMSLWEIPPAECVVFFPRGHIGNVVQTYTKIKDWFKTSEYEAHDEGYILEVYNTQQDLNENYVVEIWKEVK